MGGSAVAALITIPMLGWMVSIEDVGRYSLAMVYFTVSVMVLSLGLHQSYVRDYHIEKNEELVKVALLSPLLLLVVLSLILFFFSREIFEFIFGVYSLKIILFFSFNILLLLIVNVFSHVVRMQENAIAFSITTIAPKVLFLLFVVSCYLLRREVFFDQLLLFNGIALLITVIIFIASEAINFKEFVVIKVRKELTIRMLKFGVPLIGGGLAYWGIMMLDRVWIKAFLSLEELGFYSMATSIASSSGLLISLFGTYWQPTSFRWISKPSFYIKIRAVSRYMLIMVIVFWFFSFPLSRMMIFVLPAEYKGVEHLVPSLFGGPLLYMLSDITSIGIAWSRKTLYYLYASLLSLIFSVGVNLLLIPKIGIRGAAVASILSYLAFYLLKSLWGARLWQSIDLLRYNILLVLWVVLSVVNIFFLIPVSALFVCLLVSMYIARSRLLKVKRIIMRRINADSIQSVSTWRN